MLLVAGEKQNMIEDNDWKIERFIQNKKWIYIFWHKPNKEWLPLGRYIKYTYEDDKVIIIEDGPYLG